MAKRMRYLGWALAACAMAAGMWKVEANIAAGFALKKRAAEESVSAVRFSLNEPTSARHLYWPERKGE